MDIRLIFRNRRRTAHDEPFDAKRLKLIVKSSDESFSGARDPIE